MMKVRNKKRQEPQRRTLQIEKFEDRVVPAASVVPVEPIQVDVEPMKPAIESTQQESQGANLREGKGPEIWTTGSTGVVEKLAESVKGYMTADSFLDGHAEEKPTNSGGYQEDSSIWSDGTFTSVVEKLAPVMNGLWHDAIPEEDDLIDLSGGEENRITFPDDLGPPGIWADGTINNVIEKLAPTVNDLWHDAGEEEIPVVASASENVNGITAPDDWGPPGIWTTGPVSSIVEQLTPPGLTDMAKPNSLTAGVIDKQRPTGLADMAEPTNLISDVAEKLTPRPDGHGKAK